MNFTELYKKIRILDEESATERFQRMKAAGTLPAAPAGIPNAASGNVPGAQPVGGGVTMSNPVASKTNIAPGQPLPANAGAVRGEAYDDASSEVAPVHTDGPVTDECGMMPMPSMPPKQQDNVDMNVTMHGTGPGGIRDLMQILRNIESGDNSDPHSHSVDALFGGPKLGGAIDVVIDDGYENSPEGASGPEVFGIDAVTQTGDDMHSKGEERPKVNGGGNPMQESLVSRLSQLYREIKES